MLVKRFKKDCSTLSPKVLLPSDWAGRLRNRRPSLKHDSNRDLLYSGSSDTGIVVITNGNGVVSRTSLWPMATISQQKVESNWRTGLSDGPYGTESSEEHLIIPARPSPCGRERGDGQCALHRLKGREGECVSCGKKGGLLFDQWRDLKALGK